MWSRVDVVGDIAVMRVPKELWEHRKALAEELLRRLPAVRVVLAQATPVSGPYRLRGLEWLAGERRTHTLFREHGCVFEADLSKVYISPRLSYEHIRIARLIGESREVVLNMFAGVGCFSIVAAKHSRACLVCSVDVNPYAYLYMVKNIRRNRVGGRVVPLLGDAGEVGRALENRCDRVLMPLPELAPKYLEVAVRALRKRGFIHYYAHVHAPRGGSPTKLCEEEVAGKLEKLCRDFVVVGARAVRSVGPRWHQVVLDIEVVP